MLSSVIQSLNYLAFTGYNSPSPMSSPHHHPHPFMSPPPPPMFAPPQPQWQPYPQPQYAMPHPMTAQPFWPQMPQAPLVAQPPPQPPPQPSEEIQPPQTPRRGRRTSGQGAGEAGPSKRVTDASDDVFSSRANHQTPRSTRHSSLSPKKSARKPTTSDGSSHSHSRSKSQSASRAGPFDDEQAFPSSSRKGVQHRAADVDGGMPFETPRKNKSSSSPQKAGLARHNSAPSADEMQRTPKRSNPSPLRRSITASDLFEGRGGGDWPRSDYHTDDEAEDFDPPDSPSKRSTSRGGRSNPVANPTAKQSMRVAVELPKISSPGPRKQRIF